MGMFNDLRNIDKSDKETQKVSPAPPDPQQAAKPPDAKTVQAPVPKVKVMPKPPVKPERKERQLNAWVTADQNDTLDRLYYRLRASGKKLNKGELVGVGIEILETILTDYTPQTIDKTLLDGYLVRYEKPKQPK